MSWHFITDKLPPLHLGTKQSTLTFPGVFDPLSFLPPLPLRRFFIVPVAPEFSEQTGFLHLLFEDSQRKVDVIIVHSDDDHGITSDAIDGGALPEVSPD
jgi:hypothetical protein